MLSHKNKGPPKTHLIPESSAVMALANLANSEALGEDEANTDVEDEANTDVEDEANTDVED